MDPMMPAAEGVEVGGLVRLTTPIWLLYRILLGSAFANIGACASVATFHSVAAAGEPVRMVGSGVTRSEEHTSELQSRRDLVCRLLLEKKKNEPNSNKINTDQP